jgi:hypothetical protein
MFNWRTVWDKVFSLTFHEKPKYIHVKKKKNIFTIMSTKLQKYYNLSQNKNVISYDRLKEY